MTQTQYSVADLLRVMQRLRDPETGCPWDVRQDFKSIVPSTLEECYELAQAIEHDDFDHVAEELGDVLFQVIFYAQLGEEQDLFSFEDIVNTLVEKLLRRHPHVFADGKIEGLVSDRSSIEDVRKSWEAIKQRERHEKRQTGVLADVPLALPALSRAQKVQKRAAQVRFDWEGVPAVLDKLQEELEELREAMSSKDAYEVHNEMGDVLFTCVNLTRHLGLDAEETLRYSTDKFERRFQHMEVAAKADGMILPTMNERQREELWQRAKESSGNK